MSERDDPATEAPLTRRTLLAWIGVAAAAPAMAAAAGTSATPEAVPRAQDAASATPPGTLAPADVERYMKLHAGTSDGEYPWYYTGRIYAIRERQAPQHLFDFEGTEIYWVRRRGADDWTTTSSTLTFFREPRTRAYLDEYANPFTERTVRVSPNVLRTAPGRYSRFSPQGYDITADDRIPWLVETQSNGGVFWLTTSRYLAKAPQPWLEVQTMLANETELRDAGATTVATTFASSYVAPWLRWLEMGDAPGHMLWHAAGRKMRSLDELPDAYRARARRLQPGHFVAPVQP